MGKIIPFPTRRMEDPVEKSPELTDLIIREKILAGEAELVGIFDQNGFPCSCYHMEFDDQSFYVFDLTTRE